MRIRWHLILSILFFIGIIILGAFAYHGIEGWEMLDSFYFVVMTVTTVGYGDIVPITVTGKVFTMFYAFFGIGTAFYFLSLIGSAMFRKHVSGQVSEIKREVRKEEEVKEEIKNVVRKKRKR